MRLFRSSEFKHAGCPGWVVLAAFGSLIGQSVAEAQIQAPVYQQPQSGYPSQIQLTQKVTKNDSKPTAPLPYEIESMPDVMEDLEVVHRRSQLVIARAPIARMAIADPSVVDVVQYSPNEIGIIGVALGTTTLTLWFDTSSKPLIYLVEVIRDPALEDRLRTDFGRLEKQLQILFPASQVYLIPLRQRLVVKGQARDEEEAARILQIVRSAFYGEYGQYGGSYANGGNGAGGGAGFGGGGGAGGIANNNNNGFGDNDVVVDMLEIPGNQTLMLHVKIAELSRGQLRRLGVDINGLINNGRHFVGASVGGVPSSITGIFENGEANVLINWLSGNRTAKVLAAPTLTVLSGHSASFLAGGEFPVPTIVGVGGAQGASTSFRGFGTSLLVQPTLIDKDWIKMSITPEYSQLNSGNGAGGVPGLDSRRISTTVKLREGQTIVLAGLFGSTLSTEVNRIPFLGELPIIGPILFNAKTSDQGENELMILVTPELVRPMEPDEVPPLPGFYVTPPNDIELYSYAKTEGYPDQGIYQLNPYGWGPGYSTEVGYRPFNPATYGSPAPMQTSYGAGTGGYSVSPPGYMSSQPAALFPGPPMPQGPPAGGNYQGIPPGQMMPPQGGPPQMAPIPDPNTGGYVQPAGGMIQQVGYEQPAANGGSRFMNWMRGSSGSQTNPALRSTNDTTPSLEYGSDGRLGRDGRLTQGQERVRQQAQQQSYNPAYRR